MTHAIPELKHGRNSWIIVDRQTGQAVAELYNRALVERVNQDRYEVRTAADHLAGLNTHDKN